MLIVPVFCFGQQKWEEYILQLVEESGGEQQFENLYEDLTFLSQHPMNLNALDETQLQRLPFLSEIQIDKLKNYVKHYGPMQSIYELRLVPDLDMQTIEMLLPFVYVGEKQKQPEKFSFNNIFKYGKNELVFRFDECLNQKEGYSDISEEEISKNPNKRYLGEPFYTSLRYSFRYSNKIQFGLTAEKDAGEMFWKDAHKGYDYYSVHLLLRDFGKLKALAIGNYRLSFGQGLVMNTDFSIGKSSQVLNIDKRNIGIKRHFSTDEYNYFQGIAGSLQFGNITVTGFYSNKKIDANVDTVSQTISSIKKDGLNRTVNELNKKDAAQIQLFGGNVSWLTNHFSGGISLLQYSFDKSMEPEAKPYNYFYFRGKDNINLSIDYRYKMPGFCVFGETAVSENKALATVNGIQLEPASYCRLSLLYRYYDKEYQAFFANAFSEGSSIQNESGIYMGIELSPFAKWKFAGYADFFQFPWLRYGVNAPTNGFDGLLQVGYSPKRDMEMFFRYRYKDKTENVASQYLDNTYHTHPVDNVFTHRLRYQLFCLLNRNIKSKTTMDYTIYYPAGTTDSNNGFLISQEINWNPKKFPVKTAFQLAYFNTDDYNSRIYSYEKNVLYAFYIPSFYGEGIRSVLNLRYDIRKNLSFYFRFSQTAYFDRNVIGTGLETINGSRKNDISCLLRWAF